MRPWFAAFALCVFLSIGSAYAQTEWTFLVFMNGRNDLSKNAVIDLEEMRQATEAHPSDRINVVVQFGLEDNEEVQRIWVHDGQSEVIERLKGKAADMGNWMNLRSFIKWGNARFPAKKVFVNIWNHGGGALDQPMVKGVSYDQITGNHIMTRELGQALATVGPIDVLGIDACLMGMVEIASEVAENVDYFVASEETEPETGWNYGELLSTWAQTPSLKPLEVGKITADSFVRQYRSGVALSVLDLKRLPAFENAFAEMAADLSELSREELGVIKKAAEASLRFNVKAYVDATGLLAELEANLSGLNKVSAARMRKVRDALDRVTTYAVASNNMLRAAGVSIWVPPTPRAFSRGYPEYSTLKFDKKTQWSDVLRKMLQY